MGGKTYYYDQYTNQPVKGIQSIDNKLYYFDANGVHSIIGDFFFLADSRK